MWRRRFTSKAEKAFARVNRRYISLPDLFPVVPTNRPSVSEDGPGPGEGSTVVRWESVLWLARIASVISPFVSILIYM